MLGDKRMTVYKFKSLDRALEFIKSLIVEGNYRVSARAFYQEYPRETMIDYYEVTVEEIEK